MIKYDIIIFNNFNFALLKINKICPKFSHKHNQTVKRKKKKPFVGLKVLAG